jgi:hypothetical protein
MIGFGSPADTTRESDVIVLMVSPLLALPLVIDHNTKQGAEFPGFLHPCGESMQATHSRITAERIVGNSEPLQVEVFGGFFGHRRGAGGRPRIGMPRHKPC